MFTPTQQLYDNCKELEINSSFPMANNIVVRDSGIEEHFKDSHIGKLMSATDMSKFKALESATIYHTCNMYHLIEILTKFQSCKALKHLEFAEAGDIDWTNGRHVLDFGKICNYSAESFKQLIIDKTSALASLTFNNCVFQDLDYVLAIAPLLRLELKNCEVLNANAMDLVKATMYCETNGLSPWKLKIREFTSKGLL